MIKQESSAQKRYTTLNIASWIFGILGAICIALYFEEFPNNHLLLIAGVILETCLVLVYIPFLYLQIKLKKYNNNSFLESKWSIISYSIAMLLAIIIFIIYCYLFLTSL